MDWASVNHNSWTFPKQFVNICKIEQSAKLNMKYREVRGLSHEDDLNCKWSWNAMRRAQTILCRYKVSQNRFSICTREMYIKNDGYDLKLQPASSVYNKKI